jgi:hypothetical protein
MKNTLVMFSKTSRPTFSQNASKNYTEGNERNIATRGIVNSSREEISIRRVDSVVAASLYSFIGRLKLNLAPLPSALFLAHILPS